MRNHHLLNPDQVALVIFDVLKGYMCDSVHTLLESNKILQVHVPNNCTDLFQPLKLSVNKPFKDKLRSTFSKWYTQEVSKQLDAGTQAENVHVDMRMSVMNWAADGLFQLMITSDPIKT